MPTETKEKALTLYEAENYLAELVDTEGAVPEELKESFELEVREALTATREKREKVGQFIKQCEAEAEFAKQEAKRIRERGQRFENAAQRVREYVLHFIMSHGMDSSARFPKLEGRTLTMSARSNPASVEITHPEAVPARFKSALVEMPLDRWQVIVDAFPEDTAGALRSVEIDKGAVKAAINQGEEVVGADLNIGKYSLQIR